MLKSLRSLSGNRRISEFKKLTWVKDYANLEKHTSEKEKFYGSYGWGSKKVRGQKSLSPAFWSLKAWRSGFKI